MRIIFTLQFIAAVFITFSAGFIACKDSTTPEDNNSGIVYPDSGLSFSQHIRPIFLNSCASIGSCHQSGIQAGGLDLETDPPDFIGNHGPAVIPFRADLSNLYLLLYDQIPGISRRMPPPDFSAGGLRQNEIDAIGTWINEGANPAN